MNPYQITEPTCISFSGGRSSGYMLHKVLEANGGLPSCARVCFANTGKENEETLKFVYRCATEWGINIHWLEYSPGGFVEVDFFTASREGEPFDAVIKARNFLPNPVARFCTVELKILPEIAFLKSIGWEEWVNFIGIRADEPRRVAKIRANPSGGKKGPEREMPMAKAGVTKSDVSEFWRAQNFDLGLENVNGVALDGNCDLCFLKSSAQIVNLIRREPLRAVWWASKETSITNAKIKDGGRFRSDRPSYAEMLKFVTEQREMQFDDESLPCFCGD